MAFESNVSFLPRTKLPYQATYSPRFLRHELGWRQTKVDELLLPIIQKMNKRGQAAALNRQNNLNEFLDISAGSGTHAPRRNRAYESKRLQQVISEFRKKNKQRSGSNTPVPGSQTGDGSQDESEGMKEVEDGTSRKRQRKSSKTNGESAAKKKGRTTVASSTSRGKGKSGTSSAVTRGRGKGGSGQTRTRARKSKAQESTSELSEEMDEDEDSDVFVLGPAKDAAISETGEVNLRPRPRPRPTYKGAQDSVVEVTASGGEASTPPNASNASLNVMPEATTED